MLSPNNSSPSSSISSGCEVSPNKAPSSSKGSKSWAGDVAGFGRGEDSGDDCLQQIILDS